MEDNKLIVFEHTHIRRILFEDDWFFSVVDVIGVLTDSTNASDYWYQLKKREKKNGGVDLSTNCRKMKMRALDGKDRPTDVANTEGVLRIIMSIPSPKAEPLKKWMAQVSTDRIVETENPELSFERMTELYRAKGYTDEWIVRRVESIKARKRLTDEWKNRGIKENKDFSILTATIAKGTFGLNPSEHKALKGLEKPNQELRDHMTPLELIFTALSEETTRLVAIKEDAQGFNENHEAASKGGREVGTLRKDYEKRMGLEVISSENYLNALKEGPENPTDNKE
jgi:DNA-damage-inducible protein D